MSQSRGAALYEVLGFVRPLLLNSARVVEASLRSDGLTVGTRAVLEVLAEHGPATVPSIAHRLDLPRQGVQRHVNDLLELGHVRTQPNPAHRRSVLVSLTRSGSRSIKRVHTEELRRLAEMAPECTDLEIAAAAKVLGALSRDVRQQAADVRHPMGDSQ